MSICKVRTVTDICTSADVLLFLRIREGKEINHVLVTIKTMDQALFCVHGMEEGASTKISTWNE